MGISEEKMKIVIDNYFKTECNIDTSIREAFEKGFRIGVKKGVSAQPEQRWIPVMERPPEGDTEVIVSCTDDSGDSPFSYTTTGWRFGRIWIVDNERNTFVRAWRPMPEPYRGEDK